MADGLREPGRFCSREELSVHAGVLPLTILPSLRPMAPRDLVLLRVTIKNAYAYKRFHVVRKLKVQRLETIACSYTLQYF